MGVKEITSLSEFNSIIERPNPVVIDFWAEWCGPCKMMSPVFERLSGDAQYQGVEFYKVDVDAQSEISKQVGIRAMPTFIAYCRGKKIDELVGANPGHLAALLQKTMAVQAK